ncbi:hypothetical protein F7984_12250 [Pradoshia sp. D12]|uniref:hypothetical protein n=1 Tax=Bacillaceae TaxID=186817 RepID=UPI00112D22FE|nr:MULTISPECIES: hypothetical protein [Bacillaceae]QFK71943.1 hypothetical protein F7984_12250 [Pradoshia sp. D12]TPF71565.1 hypothetical protein FHY44_13950 [Bacillus sp. D12]
MKDIIVNFPDEILDRFNIEGVVVSPYTQTLGWAFLSEIKDDCIILRIYVMQLKSKNFELNGELTAFVFTKEVEMRNFYNQLLNMSALEYMTLLQDNTEVRKPH